MRIGIHACRPLRHAGRGRVDRATLAETVRIAEDGGLPAPSVMDHYFQMERCSPVDDPMLEGYTTLGFVAALTERIRWHCWSTGVTYRHPGLLAKIVATLDVLSGGRAELGIGAAWYEREHRGLGVPFPPVGERLERLEEAIRRSACRCGATTMGPSRASTTSWPRRLCAPTAAAPAADPRLRRRRAQDAAARRPLRRRVNVIARSPDEVAHKLDVLRAHCADEGREPATVDRTILYRARSAWHDIDVLPRRRRPATPASA